MKKLMLLAVLLMGSNAFAADVWLSSSSAITNVRGNLCPAGQGGFLHSVCIVDGVASSTAAVYNHGSLPSFSTATLTGVIDASETGKGCYDFDVAAPNGVFKDAFGTAVITVLYQCYSRN